MTTAKKVANHYSYKVRYARLIKAMSRDQAKVILGFPPNSNPSEDEIKKNYKLKAIQNHPDRGGDTQKMVEINVAKDILTGKAKERWEPSNPSSTYTRPPPPPREPPKPEATQEGQNFAKAWSSNGPPANVDWKFVSIPEYWWPEYSHTNPHLSHRVWTLYGKTDTHHVFCAFKLRAEGSATIDGVYTTFTEDWQISWASAPLNLDLTKIGPKSIKQVGTGWTNATPDAPKKFIVWTEARPTEALLKKVPRSGGVNFKSILVGIGAVSEDSAGASKIKTTVEIVTRRSFEKSARRKEQGKLKDRADQHDFILRINGKEQLLDDETVEAMKRMVIPYVLTWDKIDDNRVKNLSKMKGSPSFNRGLTPNAADAMTLLLDAVKKSGKEPSWIVTSLERAIKEYQPVEKTARIVERFLNGS